ncbi:MAG: polysaccharide deacetylase [Rubritepida sp.]|nr:polysaccharide deacetylase [Rubritepida sp.]
MQPQLWPQVLGALACNHAILSCSMHPRSAWLGPNMTRLPDTGRPTVALTFDDGPDPEVTPRILDILDAHGAKASFFLIGRKVARHPALVRELVRRGHAVENHSQRHSLAFACRGPWALWREVTEAQRAIGDACGEVPRFFRAPMGLRNPMLDPVLATEGLSLVSWTRRGYDTMRRRPEPILSRLTRGLAPGDILLLHDGSSALDADGSPVVLAVLPRLLDRISALGLRAASLSEA